MDAKASLDRARVTRDLCIEETTQGRWRPISAQPASGGWGLQLGFGGSYARANNSHGDVTNLSSGKHGHAGFVGCANDR